MCNRSPSRTHYRRDVTTSAAFGARCGAPESPQAFDTWRRSPVSWSDLPAIATRALFLSVRHFAMALEDKSAKCGIFLAASLHKPSCSGRRWRKVDCSTTQPPDGLGPGWSLGGTHKWPAKGQSIGSRKGLQGKPLAWERVRMFSAASAVNGIIPCYFYLCSNCVFA